MNDHPRRPNHRLQRRPFQYGLASLFVIQAVFSIIMSLWKSLGVAATIGALLFSTVLTGCIVGCVWIVSDFSKVGRIGERWMIRGLLVFVLGFLLLVLVLAIFRK